MSEIVQDELAQVVEGYSFAYLMTVTADGRPHAVAVEAQVTGGQVWVDGLGRRSSTNASERPRVSLLWPPPDVGGYSLIVDGEASVEGDVLTLVPTRAVRHRPHGLGGDGTTGCDSDCLPIDLAAGTG